MELNRLRVNVFFKYFSGPETWQGGSSQSELIEIVSTITETRAKLRGRERRLGVRIIKKVSTRF
jgi:hypothetical protein